MKIFTFFFLIMVISGCKVTVPEPSPGVKRGPISKAIWGEDTNKGNSIENEFESKNSISSSLSYHDSVDIMTKWVGVKEYRESDEFVIIYMKRFHEKVWDGFHRDEFAILDKVKELRSVMIKRFDGIQETNRTIMTEIKFSEYDFNTLSFHIEGLSENPIFQIEHKCNGLFPGCSKSEIPLSYKLSFKNSDLFPKELKITALEAKRLIENRREYGFIDRRAYLEVTFDLKRPMSLREGKGSQGFIAEIKNISVFWNRGDSKPAFIFEP